jgi:hypothetical protein
MLMVIYCAFSFCEFHVLFDVILNVVKNLNAYFGKVRPFAQDDISDSFITMTVRNLIQYNPHNS